LLSRAVCAITKHIFLCVVFSISFSLIITAHHHRQITLVKILKTTEDSFCFAGSHLKQCEREKENGFEIDTNALVISISPS
jgi:hypothetical protein